MNNVNIYNFYCVIICSVTKGVLLHCIPILFPKYFTLGKKAPCNAVSLESYTPFDFQPVICLVLLSFFRSSTLNVG